MSAMVAPLWRVREVYTARDGHRSQLDEWSALTKLDAVKLFVRTATADADVYTGQYSLHLVDPSGVDCTGDALLILRAVQLHHAGECADACPECASPTWCTPSPIAAGLPRSDGE